MKLPRGYKVAYSNDGSLLVAVGRFVVIHDVKQRKRIKNAHPFAHPSNAAFSPDDTLLAVKSTSGQIAVLDARSGKLLFDHANQHEGEGANVLFSRSGQHFMDGSWGGVLTIRHAMNGEIQERVTFENEMLKEISANTDRTVWMTKHDVRPVTKTSPGTSHVLLWPWPPEQARARRIELPCRIESAVIAPDGQTFCCLAGLHPPMHVLLVRIADGRVIARSAPFLAGGTGQWLGWSHDGTIIASVQQDRFAFYRATDLNLLGSVACEYPSCVAFRPGTDDVALGSWDDTRVMRLAEIFSPDELTRVQHGEPRQPLSHFWPNAMAPLMLQMRRDADALSSATPPDPLPPPPIR